MGHTCDHFIRRTRTRTDARGRRRLARIADEGVRVGQVGLDPAVVDMATQRATFGVKPLTEQVIREQQSIAGLKRR